MKQTHRNLLIGSILIGSALTAGSVTIPNSFTANTTAKASEVNANFSAVKSAVDGNAGDIATNASGITTNANDIATNTHDIQTNTTAIATKGEGDVTSVTAGAGREGGGDSGDITINRPGGHVIIEAVDMSLYSPATSGCVLYRDYSRAYWTSSTNDNCVASTPVHLPDGATVTHLTCKIVSNDGSTTDVPTVQLFRNDFGATPTHSIAEVTAGADSGSVQTLEDDASATIAEVDNSQYAFHLKFYAKNTATVGGDNKFYGCTIAYTFE